MGSGERQEIRHSGQGEKNVQKDMVMAKKTTYEQNREENYLTGAGYLGGLVSTGKMGLYSSAQ